MSNRQNLDWFSNALCDQNNGTNGAEPRVRRTLPRRNNHLLINSWFLSAYPMKFNDIFHKYKTEVFWFDGIIFVPLVRTEILHFSGISLGGRTLGTPVYNSDMRPCLCIVVLLLFPQIDCPRWLPHFPGPHLADSRRSEPQLSVTSWMYIVVWPWLQCQSTFVSADVSCNTFGSDWRNQYDKRP